MANDSLLEALLSSSREVDARLNETRLRIQSLLTSLERRAPTSTDADELDLLLASEEVVFKEQMRQAKAVIERLRQLEEEKRRTVMMEKPSSTKNTRAPKDLGQIAMLSEELTTKLRLGRVDDAIKELLGFLADDEFVSANVTTGRRRPLRSLQNAIAKALD